MKIRKRKNWTLDAPPAAPDWTKWPPPNQYDTSQHKNYLYKVELASNWMGNDLSTFPMIIPLINEASGKTNLPIKWNIETEWDDDEEPTIYLALFTVETRTTLNHYFATWEKKMKEWNDELDRWGAWVRQETGKDPL